MSPPGDSVTVTAVAPLAHTRRNGPLPHVVHPCSVNAAMSGPRASAAEAAWQSTYHVLESPLTIGAPTYEQTAGRAKPAGVAAAYGVEVAPETVAAGVALAGAEALARAAPLADAEALGAPPDVGAGEQPATTTASAMTIACTERRSMPN